MKGYVFLLLLVAAQGSESVRQSPIINDALVPRHRRSVKIPSLGSILGGKKGPEVPHLGSYPLWKVHRYHGISLQPISIPGDQVPSSLPIPPTLSGEAPSIVNVPDPHHAPREVVTPPPNEYGPPPSGPYPPSAPYPPSSPYPPASLSAPYPPAGPSAPYPPAGPPGPYAPPTAPHPPVFHSQAHSNTAASSSAAAGATGYSAPPSEFAEPPFNSGAQGGPFGNFADLQSMLPPELAQKFQQYTSTPQGRERVSALLKIATNAQKLKTNAASSLQGILHKFFGGAGGSTNIALESGTYTNIPKVYPVPQGIFNSLKPVGTGVSGSLLPNLPDAPPLPKIPGLAKLPPTPGLPHINLPYVPYKEAGGQYVSFSIPQGSNLHETNSNTYEVPPQSYSNVPTIPSTSYGTPVGQTFVPSPQTIEGDSSSFFKSPEQTNNIPNLHSSIGDVPSFYQTPSQSYGAPLSESSGGDISTFFQAPSSTYGLSYDSSSAGSEADEELQLRQNQATGEVVEVSNTPLKITKLHRVQNTENFQNENTKIIGNQQAIRQTYQGFQPMGQNEHSVEESLREDSQ